MRRIHSHSTRVHFTPEIQGLSSLITISDPHLTHIITTSSNLRRKHNKVLTSLNKVSWTTLPSSKVKNTERDPLVKMESWWLYLKNYWTKTLWLLPSWEKTMKAWLELWECTTIGNNQSVYWTTVSCQTLWTDVCRRMHLSITWMCIA